MFMDFSDRYQWRSRKGKAATALRSPAALFCTRDRLRVVDRHRPWQIYRRSPPSTLILTRDRDWRGVNAFGQVTSYLRRDWTESTAAERRNQNWSSVVISSNRQRARALGLCFRLQQSSTRDSTKGFRTKPTVRSDASSANCS
jgi:hypothetical protein